LQKKYQHPVISSPALKSFSFIPERPVPVLLFSALALLILAFFSVGYYHPDEHFQILEFAAWKLNQTPADQLPWEFHFQIRPAIQPAMVVFVHKLFYPLGITSPFILALILRLFSAMLSFLAVCMICRRYLQEIEDETLRKWFVLLSFLLWFFLYNAVRFCSETLSGSIFIIGFTYLFSLSRNAKNVDYLLTGILLGFSFLFRFQAGFLIAGFILWFLFVKKEKGVHLLMIFSGLLLIFFLGICIDRWFYGKWTITAWNYFQQNIVADKISGFGIKPWWYYFQDLFIQMIPPFSLVIIASFVLVFVVLRKDLLTWTLVPFLIFHFFIGHKETRFLFPLIGFIPVVVIKAIEIIQEKYRVNLVGNRYFIATVKIFWTVNILFIFIVFFNPADSQVNMFQKIYSEYPNGITLYYFDENPYHRALNINFYKRSNLVLKQATVETFAVREEKQTVLVAIRSQDPGAALFRNQRLVYSSYPEWIRNFNVNHWMERTNFWYVYEVKN
jgi:GPI mannosyltransferase 3